MAANVNMRDHTPAIRAGKIGPIRREIVFEPLPERPAPDGGAAAPPDQKPKEPVPNPAVSET
jgi:hypothetical protein